MKTKALLLAAILFATGSSVCFAANDNKSETATQKENAKQNKGDRQRKAEFNPFEGLNLTESQQAKLNDVRAEFRKKGEGCQKADGQQKCDKSQDAQKQKVDRAQAKRDYLAKVKAILTPEQYVTFLENMTVNRPEMGKRQQGVKGQRPQAMNKGQKGKKDMKEGRGNKSAANQQAAKASK